MHSPLHFLAGANTPDLSVHAGPGEHPEALPLTPAQRRLWRESSRYPAARRNLTAAVRLTGQLDQSALEQALAEIVSRHSALRTVLAEGDSRPVQMVGPARAPDLTIQDASALPRSEVAPPLEGLLDQEAQHPFNLVGGGPLLRVTLVTLGPREHGLLLAVHPLICDRRSLMVLTRDLAAVYADLRHGRAVSLPTVTDGWQEVVSRLSASGPGSPKPSAYWKEQLADLPSVLALPTDRPRPAQPMYRRGEHRFRLPATLANSLREMVRASDVSQEAALLTAFGVLLGRYSGQEEIVVGIPAAGCPRPDAWGLVGRFETLVPVRIRLGENPTVWNSIRQVRAASEAARNHADVLFEELGDGARSGEGSEVRPLFPAVFSLREDWSVPVRADGLLLTPLALESDLPPCEVALELRTAGPHLVGRLVYNAELFEVATAAAMVRHFGTLLAAAVAEPGQAVCDLPLLSSDEQCRILGDWNATRQEYPDTSCVHELFAAQAARMPEAVALSAPDVSLSYGELDRRAEELARRLRELGVGPDVLVGLCADRSVEAVIAMLAVAKAGGAYLPLDPSYPRDRLTFMLADAKPRVLLTYRHLLGVLPQTEAAVVLLDEIHLEEDKSEIRNPKSEASGSNFEFRISDLDRPTPDNLAYVIYTSGSTGQPKGVLIEHGGLTNLALAQARAFDVHPGDRVLQFASLSFDASVSEIWVTLLAGATLVLAPRDALMPGPALERLLLKEAITSVTLPPSVLEVMPPRDYPALRSLIVAGEACSPEVAHRWAAGRRFLNAYGPTEGTVCATIGTCVATERPAIGRPIANVRVYVLDRRLQPVPVGVPGELYIGGVGVARGYLNRPSLTAERFLSDPFGEPGGRLYKTGDLVRWLPSGELDFLGRFDQQIKVHGYRIEVSEVETALLAHPQVRQAVVTAWESSPGKKRLVAYVVSAQPAPTSSALRRFLKERLPAYMVPSVFVPLAELPRTPGGKVDRKALPAPERSRDGETAFVAPRTPLEQFLGRLWEEVLELAPLGVRDNFFELGGTSLQVAFLAQKLQDKLGEYVYTIALFDAPTVEQLARYLVRHYPAAVARTFGTEMVGANGSASSRRLTERDVADFRHLVRELPPRSGPARPKNQRAVFVLSPPRSGSTLFRVVLAGHPGLFAPPELQLLNFNTLADRRDGFASERDRFWLNGVVRALMEIRGWEAERASQFLEECERSGMSIQEFYGLLQGWLGERRLVDKTPFYALDPSVLRRAEEDFEDTRYIYLVRRPGAMIASFEEAKLHLFFPAFLKGGHRYSARELAELVWVVSHQNIQEFLRTVPAERQHRVLFEEMVREPRPVIEGVCRFLGLDFHPDMLEPYKDKKSRMTDPHHPMARMLGDVKFHEHRGIDARAAERKRSSQCEESLGEVTMRLGRELGYSVDKAKKPVPLSPCHLVTLSSTEGRPNQRPLFWVHGAGGTVACYRELVRALDLDRPFHAFQAPGLTRRRGSPRRVEELAAVYLAELRQVQPEGPYHLGGWSFGGVVAFEMARQLAEQGQATEHLVLVDSNIPQPGGQRPLLGMRRFLMELGRQHGLDTVPDLLHAVGRRRWLQHILERARQAGIVPADLGPRHLRRLVLSHARTFSAHLKALWDYAPRPWLGRVLLFRPTERVAPLAPPLDWTGLASAVECLTVPGDHYSMIREPHVHALAAHLRERLQDAEG
jgi:amino acid adenylation domain-containing protein